MRSKIGTFFLTLCIFISALTANQLPEPYNSLKIIQEDTFGWYQNKDLIEDLFRQNDIRTVVEVGSWVGGGSTRHMGGLLREKQGKLYSVDTWLGNPAQQVGEARHQPVLSYVYQQFMSNMVHWDLAHIVIPIRMKSIEAANALNIQPDLVYIDAEHSYESVYQDLTAWYPFVKERGILCGDDWKEWDSVRQAVEKFASDNELEVVSSGNFWRLVKSHH